MHDRVSLLKRFKDETLVLHREAECFVRILDADATVEDYRRYLVAMHGYVAPLEAALAARLATTPRFDAGDRCVKATWARRDLAALDTSELPECQNLPRIDSPARALGAAYVLEGSTLGGRFILAKLPPVLAALRGRATRYLEGYRALTGERWRGFAAVVGATVTARADEDRAVEAACETFARLVDWLGRFEERRAPLLAS